MATKASSKDAAPFATTSSLKDAAGLAVYEAPVPRVSTSDKLAPDWSGDLLAIGVYEEALETTDEVTSVTDDKLKSLDKSMSGLISEMIELNSFTAKKGSTVTQRHGANARFVSLIGLGSTKDAGKPSTWGPTAFQSAGAAVAVAAKTCKAKTAAIAFIGGPGPEGPPAHEALSYGFATGAYESTRFKASGKPPVMQEVEMLGQPSADAAIARGLAIAKGNLFTRFLVEAPPNVCTPTYLAGAAQKIASDFPAVMSCKVLEQAECEAMNMGCYLGVAECSAEPPKFIHLTYKPASGPVKKKVAIVGKGVTFDAGGYNIKTGPGCMIDMMKFDMGGAGAVFGAARAIAEIAPPGVEVHFLSAACENMIDGKGMRPGDILVSASGKTVEVGNTDAEGRLTLCDAIWYAQEKIGVDKCVDIATLTGAQIVALGVGMGALMSPHDDLASDISAAGCKTGGEKWWRLPLEESYEENLKSKIADTNNIAGRGAGSITAGLFLKSFVDPEKMEWAHLDIAGPCWDEKLGGATGFGASTLVAWAEKQGQE